MRGLSLVAASGGHSSLWCAGLSLSRPLLLRSTGSRRTVSVVEAHGPSCSAACGIFPDQGSNPCPLHWQADSQPLCHKGSPDSHCLCVFLLPHILYSLFHFALVTKARSFLCPIKLKANTLSPFKLPLKYYISHLHPRPCLWSVFNNICKPLHRAEEDRAMGRDL